LSSEGPNRSYGSFALIVSVRAFIRRSQKQTSVDDFPISLTCPIRDLCLSRVNPEPVLPSSDGGPYLTRANRRMAGSGYRRTKRSQSGNDLYIGMRSYNLRMMGRSDEKFLLRPVQCVQLTFAG
jgi:hypothetical protein